MFELEFDREMDSLLFSTLPLEKTLLGPKVIGWPLLILPKLERSPALVETGLALPATAQPSGPCSISVPRRCPRFELVRDILLCLFKASFSCKALSFAAWKIYFKELTQ